MSDPHPVTRGELDALTHEVAELRVRLDNLATVSQLAEFAKFNMAALLANPGILGRIIDHVADHAELAVTAAQALVDELEARG